ncbi:hypothetical protein [Streptomyces pseudogriseolus]|uniref:hypothetical protein n=1 Tax=Streptomyces pseudogriseolus TaxID=36817 RepID=UPI003FA2D894
MNTGATPAHAQEHRHASTTAPHVPAQPTGKQPSKAAPTKSAEQPVIYATEKEARQARKDIERLNQLADRNQNWVMGIGAVALIFTITNVTIFAVDHGIPIHIAWILDLVVNLALVRVLYTDGRLALLIPGYKPAGWSLALRYFAFTATWLMNAWSSLFPDGKVRAIPRELDPAGLLLHSALPILVFVMAEYSSHNRRRTTDRVTQLQAVIDSYEEGVKAEAARVKAEAERKRQEEDARRRRDEERQRREEDEERERQRAEEQRQRQEEADLRRLDMQQREAEAKAAAARAEAEAAAARARAEAEAAAAAARAQAEADAARIAAETQAEIERKRADYELQQQAEREAAELRRQEEERRRAEEAERKRQEAAERERAAAEERRRKLEAAQAAAKTTPAAPAGDPLDDESEHRTHNDDVVEMSREERRKLQDSAIQEAAIQICIYGSKDKLPFTTTQFGAQFHRKPRWGGMRINEAAQRLGTDAKFRQEMEELALKRMEQQANHG